MSQKVLVAGSGISGIAAAKLLLAKGGEVVLYDGMISWMQRRSRRTLMKMQRYRSFWGNLRGRIC